MQLLEVTQGHQEQWCWVGQSGALLAWAPGGSQGTALCPGALPRKVPTLELSFLHSVWNSSAMKSRSGTCGQSLVGLPELLSWDS